LAHAVRRWDELLTEEDLMPEVAGGGAGTILDADLPSDDESDDVDFGSGGSEDEDGVVAAANGARKRVHLGHQLSYAQACACM
jgi:hypothetical protein